MNQGKPMNGDGFHTCTPQHTPPTGNQQKHNCQSKEDMHTYRKIHSNACVNKSEGMGIVTVSKNNGTRLHDDFSNCTRHTVRFNSEVEVVTQLESCLTDPCFGIALTGNILEDDDTNGSSRYIQKKILYPQEH
jgi:hypothetical protein